MWILKYDTNECICEKETDSWTQRTYLWWPRERACLGEQVGEVMQAFIYRMAKQGPTV